jgi:hypothetical protein
MYERDRTLVEKLPPAAYVVAIGLLMLGAGLGLDRLGFYVGSGIVAALAVVVLALAILGQGLIWVLAAFE